MYNLTKKREILIIFDENIPIFHVKKEQIATEIKLQTCDKVYVHRR